MAERNVDVVSDGWSYLECPRWHEGRLWVSDFYTEKVVAIDDAGHHEVMAEVPEQPSGLGFLPDGRALIVSMRDHRILRREDDGSLVEHADLSGLVADHLNDMVVDARGGAYVGNFGFDLMGGAPHQLDDADLRRPRRRREHRGRRPALPQRHGACATACSWSPRRSARA